VTSPTPDDGKFVTSGDVVARFVGVFPADRVTWVKWRILDVENELMNKVPSLATIDVDADPADPDPVVAAVGRRVRSVETLVIDKVLELFNNPKGGTSVTSSMDGFSTTYGFTQNRDASKGTGVHFTEEELNRVRLPRKRRPKFGTYGVAPWGVPC
jgi:hypothetical protein